MSSTVSSGKLHHVNFETKHDENKNEHGVVTNDDYSIYNACMNIIIVCRFNEAGL